MISEWLYLRLIKLIRNTSIDRFDRIKSEIRKIKPSQFPGQDLNAMARKIQVAAMKLDTAGQYDHNLTLAILDNFLEAGGGNGPDPETYRFPLRNKRGQLETKLSEIAHMDPSVAQVEMTRNNLTWHSICNLSKNQYQSLSEKNKWEPAQHARDTKVPPGNYGNVATPAVAAANVLIQQGHARDTSRDTCNKCGEIGHWANQCPNPRQSDGGRQTNGGRNNTNNRRTSGGRTNGRDQNRNHRPGGAPNTSWKKKEPTNGEPTVKTGEDRLSSTCL
jgi:hypothetical protein